MSDTVQEPCGTNLDGIAQDVEFLKREIEAIRALLKSQSDLLRILYVALGFTLVLLGVTLWNSFNIKDAHEQKYLENSENINTIKEIVTNMAEFQDSQLILDAGGCPIVVSESVDSN